MHDQIITKPSADHLTAYMSSYVNQVEEEDLISALRLSMQSTISLLGSLDDAMGNYRYAEGKWTLNEVLAHIIDTERIFCYRALTIARNDTSPMPGFDQDTYVPNSNASNRTLKDLVEEYEIVRLGTIILFDSFSPEMLDRQGTANNTTQSPRIIGFMTAGHDIHHYHVINSKYLEAQAF